MKSAATARPSGAKFVNVLLLVASAIWASSGRAQERTNFVSQLQSPSNAGARSSTTMPNGSAELMARLRQSALQRLANQDSVQMNSPAFPSCYFSGGLCGAVTKEGDQIIKPAFDWIGNFHEGVAAFRLNGRYGYVDAQGKIVSGAQFSRAGDFWKGYAEVSVGGNSALIDREGQLALEVPFARSMPFDHEVSWVKVGSQKKSNAYGDDALVINRGSFLFTDVFIDGGWNLIRKSGEINGPEGIVSIKYFDKNNTSVMWALVEGGWGLLRSDGHWQTAARYRSVEEINNGFAVVNDGERWGYVDRDGDPVIRPQFLEARSFSTSGIAAVRSTAGWTYIDGSGTKILDRYYDGAERFGDDGFAIVSFANKWGIIDRGGQWVLEPSWARILRSRNSTVLVEDQGRKTGAFELSKREWIVLPQFDQAPTICDDGWVMGFSERRQRIVRDERKPLDRSGDIELAATNCEDPFMTKRGPKVAFLSRRLEWLSDEFDAALLFSEHRAAVRVGDSFGYIDDKGSWVVEPQFEEAQQFRNGFAVVKKGGKYGYLRSDGRLVTGFQFEEASSFYAGAAVVVRGGIRGLIGPDGGWIAETIFKTIDANRDAGLVPVSVSGRWGFADAIGSIVIDAKYDAAMPFSRGVAWVKEQGRWCPIDKVARVIPSMTCQVDAPVRNLSVGQWPD